MNHLFKQQSLKEIVKYNQWLLGACVLSCATCFLLSLKTFRTSEQWVLVPATSPEKRLSVSSRGYGETYLKEWAIYVMQTLMTTSSETVERQLEELRVVSCSDQDLEGFFRTHQEFVKGSTVESVFFPKSVTFKEGAVIIGGQFRYWLGSSEKPISQDRTYRLSYKRGLNNILLLKGVREESHHETSF